MNFFPQNWRHRIRYNSDLKYWEYYIHKNWIPLENTINYLNYLKHNQFI